MVSLKKGLAVLAAVALLFSVAGCSSKPSSSEAPGTGSAKKVIKFGIGLNDKSPQYKGLEKFKEIVEKESNGRFEVQLYHSSQLGDDVKLMEGLRMGTIEMTSPSTAPIAGLNKQFMVFDLPFLFPNEQVADKVLDGPVGQKLLDSLTDKGIIGLAYWENGYRQLTNSKREVKTPEDLVGLKIRTMENPVHLASFRAMGANPSPMPFGELFTAMEQNTIDGQENPLTTIYLQKYYEVQKYCTLTNHFYSPFVTMMSKKFWDGLSPEDQALMKKAALEAGAYERQVNRQMMKEMADNLRQAGMTVTELTPEQAEAFRKKTEGVAAQFEDQIGKDIIEAVKAEIAKNE
ncbi:MAG TPA: TRAP transporter substrate-binding protein [Firmicutes bacterium]|nr:TRAP-type transport system periplasmic protein [Bacillota bacterium]MDK2926985.1 TRAP-type transport system periplasmic protein [Bacillota bacterium]HHV56393.1 TRAP transporter substrate-binding protein [Bacillota bacterium]